MEYLIQAINTLNSVHSLINHQKLAMGSMDAEHVLCLLQVADIRSTLRFKYYVIIVSVFAYEIKRVRERESARNSEYFSLDPSKIPNRAKL